MVETISVYLKFRFKNVPRLSSGRPMRICSDMVLYMLAIFTTLSDAVLFCQDQNHTHTAASKCVLLYCPGGQSYGYFAYGWSFPVISLPLRLVCPFPWQLAQQASFHSKCLVIDGSEVIKNLLGRMVETFHAGESLDLALFVVPRVWIPKIPRDGIRCEQSLYFQVTWASVFWSSSSKAAKQEMPRAVCGDFFFFFSGQAWGLGCGKAAWGIPNLNSYRLGIGSSPN